MKKRGRTKNVNETQSNLRQVWKRKEKAWMKRSWRASKKRMTWRIDEERRRRKRKVDWVIERKRKRA